MCRATDALRSAIGITEYVPGSRPHARVRKPTWHGARGNGSGVASLPPLVLPAHPVIDRLAREHRLIRQILADDARRDG